MRRILRRRNAVAAFLASGVLALSATPASATFYEQEADNRSLAGGSGRIARFREPLANPLDTGGIKHALGVSVTDSDPNNCIEIWADFDSSTGAHHNPYMFRRCSGGSAYKDTIPWPWGQANGVTVGMETAICRVPGNIGLSTPTFRTAGQCTGEIDGSGAGRWSARELPLRSPTEHSSPNGVIAFNLG